MTTSPLHPTRRHFIAAGTALAGSITLLPFGAMADAHASNVFELPDGKTLTVHPVSHASIVMETPLGTIYVDPVGPADDYAAFPPADLVMITHEHGDHFNVDTLGAIVGEKTKLITNPAVFDKLPDVMKTQAVGIGNDGTANYGSIAVQALPAYNTTEERLKFHPKGRDHGYVLNIAGFRIYISGDTEDIPEMRALEDIDLAFVCMNLPFTMDANAAASAVSEFAPTFVYPYHSRGRDGGTQDPQSFAKMVGGGTEVRFGDWY